MRTWIRQVAYFLGLALIASQAFAAQTITSVSLNGGATAPVAPGASLTIKVDVTTTFGTRWRSTWWQINGVSSGCYNNSNHDSSGDYSESFNVTAPAPIGSYTVGIYVSSDNNCGSTTSGMTSLTNALVVVPPPPTVSSINLASASPSNATSVAWTVTFSANVSGVDVGDFVLVPAGGVSGTSIAAVAGGPRVYTVTANAGAGSGTLGLNLVDNDSIADASASTNKLGGAGAGNGNFIGQVYTIDKTPPVVSSITRIDANPASLSTVSWSVVFSKGVTGVDSTDFSLIQSGGVRSATITSVSGSGTTWAVTANVGVILANGTLGLNLVDDDTIVDGLGNKLGGTGLANGGFVGEVYSIVLLPCNPPSNIPSNVVVSCVCDNFNRGSLNPSTIFNSSNWLVSTSDTTGINPRIVNSGYLRLTENTLKNAKAATVPGVFPAAGNYISVEFKHYAYNGSNPGADGVAVTLSDYSTPVVPGAFGGSLGYAQKTGISGFAGGWVGIALDEYGNYSNATEGRDGGEGATAQSVGVRGPGAGTNGYRWMGGKLGGLGIDNYSAVTPAPGYRYQIVVDARNVSTGQTLVYVNRDSTNKDGTAYANLFGGATGFNAYPEANYALTKGWITKIVPDFWKISFTGSTGDSSNIHEIGNLRVCAQTIYSSPTDATASNFNAIDDVYPFPAPTAQWQNYQNGHIYTKLAGVAFKLNVAALSSTGLQTVYAFSTDKSVTVKLIDNSDGVCGIDISKPNYCNSACTGKTAISGGTQTLIFTAADQGQKQTADFTISKAYANLVAIIDDGSIKACSTDAFAVRPTAFTSVTSTGSGAAATNADLTGTPVFKAGTDAFNLTVSTDVGGYNGTPKINTVAMQANGTGWLVGAFNPAGFSAANAGASSSTAATSFTYDEVGNFKFFGFDPATDSASARGVYDDSWSVVDQGMQNDCVAGSYSNVKVNGKYGCLFGLSATTSFFGRFVPDHFALLSGSVTPFCSGVTRAFTYMGQPGLKIGYKLEARNGGNAKTSNYAAGLTPTYPSLAAPALVAEDQAASNQGCDLGSRIGGLPAASWVAGVYDVPATNMTFSRPAIPAVLDATTSAKCASTVSNAGGPFWSLDIGVKARDADGVVISEAPTLPALDMDADSAGICGAGSCTARRLGSSGEIYGKLQLANAYGSEMLDLPLSLEAKYWNPAGYYVINPDDSCTTITASSVIFSAFTSKLDACETQLSPNTTINFSKGKGSVKLLKPGADNSGSVSLALNIGNVVAVTDKTCVSSTLSAATAADLPWFGAINPTARATFGVFKTPLIHRREVY